MTQLASGSLVGSYELVDMIGHTGMSQVWKARDPRGQTVALKTMASEASGAQHLRARFLREGSEHMMLKHPSIVPILDFFEQGGNLYLVMQYIPGGSLEDRLERQGWQALPIAEALNIARQILSALDYAHQRLIVHRDVKPSNILLDGERAYLSDFGIALSLARPRLTTYAQLLGTRCYMSPEQIQTPLEIDHLSDVYSFGCVLYEMLTGHQPYFIDESASPETQYAMLAKRIYEPPTVPREWNKEIPPRLERILLTSLGVDPQSRVSGCGSLLCARVVVASESDIPVRVPDTPPPSPIPSVPDAEVSQQADKPATISVAGSVLACLGVGLLWTVIIAQYDNAIAAVALLAAVCNFPLLLVVRKAWAALPAKSAPTTPAKMAAWLAVPIFNLYWCWRAFSGFARKYNQQLEQIAPGGRAESEIWYHLFCLCAFYLPIVVVLFKVQLAPLVVVLQMLVLFPMMAGMLAKAVNRLPSAMSKRIAVAHEAEQVRP